MTMAEAPSAAPVDPVSNDKAAIARLSAQLKKLNEANGKYKNLLKLAKERIQQGGDELTALRDEKTALEERLVAEEKEAASRIFLDDAGNDRVNVDLIIVRVCQRVKVRTRDGLDEIWALMEMEAVPNDLMETTQPPRRHKEWKRFDTESELQDFIRRDTGEPLTLPPYSLSPDQSAQIQEETSREIAKVTEEFRRFRVRSELARKQADAQIRDLQSNSVQSVARRIEGTDIQHELEMARTAGGQLERMRAEMAAQEAHWKEAYDMLLAENTALKSSGSEAMLAAQWRQRYEACAREKEDLQSRLSNKTGQMDQSKYEAKYRDLKESFRLYRRKAKEIFEAQQNGGDAASHAEIRIASNSSADAKLSYLKNLMVNYFTSDQAMQDHMQTAIGTVLQFSPDEKARIEKKRAEQEAWFYS